MRNYLCFMCKSDTARGNSAILAQSIVKLGYAGERLGQSNPQRQTDIQIVNYISIVHDRPKSSKLSGVF